MDQSDPTLVALADLDKPGKFRVRKGVPIFMEHVHPKTGDRVDRRVLEKMARVNNRRLQESGTPGSLIIGHTPGRKEEELVHVGFHKNYRVGRFGPKKKLGLLCDQYYKPELYNKAMQFPHRSIERWSDETIDVVSLLAQTPDLDLGILLPDEGPVEKTLVANDGAQLICYSRGGNRRLYQMIEDQGMDIQALLDGFQAVIDKARDEVAAPKEPAPDMVQYSKAKFQELQMERDEAVRKSQETLKLYQRQTRIQELTALKNEGVLLDVEDEYKDTEALDQDGFTKHVEKVKKCYQRGAPAANFIPTGKPANDGDVDTEYNRLRPLVMEYAEKNKCSTAKAFEMVRARK